MPGPFPGMDPWLEGPALFPDFHTRFLGEFSNALNAVLPPPFYSGLSTRVWLDESKRRVEPDVDVFRPRHGAPLNGAHRAGGGGVALAALPATGMLEIVAPLPDEERRETYVEVYAAAGGERLVASVELLSPSNKTPWSGGRDLFRAKQQEMILAGVHLLEIDLLRQGTHATLVPYALLRDRAGDYDYHACLHWAERRDSFFVAPVRLPDRLPAVPVPLTPDVPPAVVDLQAVLDRSYDLGLYARRARYADPPDPPLAAEQRAWAEGILRARGAT